MPLTIFCFVFTETFVVRRGKNADGSNVSDFTEVRPSILPLTSSFLFDSVTVCPVWRHQDHLVQKATEVKR